MLRIGCDFVNEAEAFAPRSVDGAAPLKRVAAIHDMSCFGRCALTVIMPVLSVMGLQTVPVPTCLLSTHTGGFTDMYFEELGDSMERIAEHFDRLGLRFDAIYTGFLGSCEQIKTVRSFIDRFAERDTLVLVDPVMGDGGELYSTYTDELMRGMSELCRRADIITPNLTEACFLTNMAYRDTSLMTAGELEAYARELCGALAELGAHRAVITGLYKGDAELCVCGKDYVTNEFFSYAFERINKNYPGTGDVFASVLLGALMRGNGLEPSIRQAADFTRRVIEYSAHFTTDERDGVALEAFLGELAAPSPKLCK